NQSIVLRPIVVQARRWERSVVNEAIFALGYFAQIAVFLCGVVPPPERGSVVQPDDDGITVDHFVPPPGFRARVAFLPREVESKQGDWVRGRSDVNTISDSRRMNDSGGQ